MLTNVEKKWDILKICNIVSICRSERKIARPREMKTSKSTAGVSSRFNIYNFVAPIQFF